VVWPAPKVSASTVSSGLMLVSPPTILYHPSCMDLAAHATVRAVETHHNNVVVVGPTTCTNTTMVSSSHVEVQQL
jgi:hypothetical protein